MKLINPDNRVHGKYYVMYRKMNGNHKTTFYHQYNGIFSTNIGECSNRYKESIFLTTRIGTHPSDIIVTYELTDDEVYSYITMMEIIVNL